MKDPAILFYTADFLTGTFTMSDDQVGKYIRLLCLQHQKGFLCEKDMLKICKSYDEDIYSKFIKEGEKYYNERMKFEAEKRKKYSESRSENRKHKSEKPLKSNKIKPKNISKSYVKHMENEIENEIVIENELVIKPENKKPKPIKIESDSAFIICRDAYFQFYKELTNKTPTFNGAQGANLKRLLPCIRQTMQDEGMENTDENVLNSFKLMLNNLPAWIRKGLSINLIYSQYDGIIAEIRSKSGANQKNIMQDIIADRDRKRKEAAANG